LPHLGVMPLAPSEKENASAADESVQRFRARHLSPRPKPFASDSIFAHLVQIWYEDLVTEASRPQSQTLRALVLIF
jgi:hypothetical protein